MELTSSSVKGSVGVAANRLRKSRKRVGSLV